MHSSLEVSGGIAEVILGGDGVAEQAPPVKINGSARIDLLKAIGVLSHHLEK
jgi:hypothetical protein